MYRFYCLKNNWWYRMMNWIVWIEVGYFIIVKVGWEWIVDKDFGIGMLVEIKSWWGCILLVVLVL